MQLLLVRHGEPLAVTDQAGGADPELSPQGHTQAAALGAWAAGLTGEKVVEVVVSGMRRAQETAAPAAAALGLEPVVDPDLAEFDVGRPSYRPVHERLGSEDPDWQRITAGYLPEFVDAEAFTARVRGAFGRIVERHRDAGRESVLVVCHAGVINTYLALQLGLDKPLYFPLDHAGLSRVLVSRGGRVRVRSVNETGHVTEVL
ncbi:histidine phosphatase family protein [Actinomycetospora endophytica]|uniref:Histidine phosphatase family protein n=1 Tax=Actinomycetospora endophytica TaxID=2291215 RepID=A0ABS8PB71_9PSEU|nr:histidine phosphatase family protein [Actinomycetospora endophytica]MCD2195518.1 histidine phosphatase family protein [Actinomycetospora endophytica]